MSKKDAGFERKRAAKLAKQKAKKAKEAKQRPTTFSATDLAYSGNRYKHESFVDVLFAAERGIYEAFVMCERKLIDAQVRGVLGQLVHDLRHAGPDLLSSTGDENAIVSPGPDLIRTRILQNWSHKFETRPQPPRSDLAGILRTIVHSLDLWTAKNPNARGYLNYLEGFLSQLGVEVVKVVDPETEGDISPKNMLLSMGRDWIDRGDEQAHRGFRELAEDRILHGGANEVVEICQKLIGQVGNAAPLRELQDMAMHAHRQIGGENAVLRLGTLFG